MSSHHQSEFNTSELTRGGARPMKVYLDKHGNEWLCDHTVDQNGDFAAQGCWRTDEMAFDRNF